MIFFRTFEIKNITFREYREGYSDLNREKDRGTEREKETDRQRKVCGNTDSPTSGK